MTNNSTRVRRITETGLFLTLTLALSYLEHLLPVLPMMPPGVKPGLANIVIMYCLLVSGAPSALILTVLKSLFVLMTRGTIAGALSLLGSLFSVLVMFLLSRIKKPRLSYLFLSIAGAIFHNLGQLVGASVLVSRRVIVYVPVLILSGIFMGTLTGTILRVVMPALHKLRGHQDP